MSASRKDQIFASPIETPKKFAFDDTVASVFPDMIKRSVPGYDSVVNLSGLLAARFAQNNSHVYDLGCSLGATSLAMANGIQKTNCRIFAIDNSEAMILGLRDTLKTLAPSIPVIPVHSSIQDYAMENASMVAMNYTLQFVPVDERPQILGKIRQSLNPGGALILSEKIAFEDASVNQHFVDLYHDFKRANGYSDLEISQKRDALEQVLIPETIGTHKARLLESGFGRVEVWFQCFNFASIVAFT